MHLLRCTKYKYNGFRIGAIFGCEARKTLTSGKPHIEINANKQLAKKQNRY